MTYLVTFKDGSQDLLVGDSASEVRALAEADFGRKVKNVKVQNDLEDDEEEDDEQDAEEDGEEDDEED